MADDLRYYPICEWCVRGEGSECHTPECALWMRDVPPDGLIRAFAVDLAAVRAEVWFEALSGVGRWLGRLALAGGER